MTVLEKIKSELKAFEEKRSLLVKELQKEFPTLFKPLFDKSEKIKSIGWKQYTPYFNDGDSCTFGVYNDEPDINGESIWDIEDENNFWDEEIGYPRVPNPNYDEKEGKIYQEFIDVLQSIPEDFYESLFGDHCTVTIYKDGRIETEEYDHD